MVPISYAMKSSVFLVSSGCFRKSAGFILHSYSYFLFNKFYLPKYIVVHHTYYTVCLISNLITISCENGEYRSLILTKCFPRSMNHLQIIHHSY